VIVKNMVEKGQSEATVLRNLSRTQLSDIIHRSLAFTAEEFRSLIFANRDDFENVLKWIRRKLPANYKHFAQLFFCKGYED